MVQEAGATAALVGHSERRHLFGETDDQVARKTAAALNAGLTPLVCVGETLAEREGGRTEAVILRQLAPLLERVSADDWARLVVAYEPVWAIGTGEVATPDDAQEVCAHLRARLEQLFSAEVADAVRVLYGGSVKASNVAAIMSQGDVDGALVGGASLKADEFASICRYRQHHTAGTAG
jgi:triosephosphate isomerase (TIM)